MKQFSRKSTEKTQPQGRVWSEREEDDSEGGEVKAKR